MISDTNPNSYDPFKEQMADLISLVDLLKEYPSISRRVIINNIKKGKLTKYKMGDKMIFLSKNEILNLFKKMEFKIK